MAPYIVGIDLGTTHTVVAWAPSRAVADDAIQLFEIAQLVGLGEVAARPLLPSVLYQPAAGEIPEGDLVLPWGRNPEGAVVGSLARERGAAIDDVQREGRRRRGRRLGEEGGWGHGAQRCNVSAS
jgi:molecular chaperone DnaK (HSP70)